MDFSLVASTFDILRIAPPSKLTLLEARTLADAHVPPFPPDMPALLVGVDSPALAARIIDVLLAIYPRDQEISIVEGHTSKGQKLGDLQLSTFNFRLSICWFIPSLGEGTSFESFAELVAHLRAPNGCPWDREQTHESLRKHLLEESYEAISAIDSGDFAEMREEFGDMLLQVVLQSQIANEETHFNISQVIQGIHAKIVHRHPHVFGDLNLDGVDGVLANWEKLKEAERREQSAENSEQRVEKGLLDGVPLALPALSQAQEYQDRAARVGFDWPSIDGVLDKVAEEILEIKTAKNDEELAAELGDLFFVLVNFARWKKLDAESALRGTNMKFKKRFAHIDRGAREQGRNVSELKLDEMESLWQAAKGKRG